MAARRGRNSGAAAENRTLAARLSRDISGEVLFDSFSRGRYATDASFYQIMPAGVVVPRTVDEALRTLAICREAGRSHANGPDARRGLAPPVAASAMISSTTTPTPTAERPITARVRPIVLDVPVAVARAAEVVAVAVTTAVLRNAAFGRRFRFRGGGRLGRGPGRFRFPRGLWRFRCSCR